jgi:hypothetical protein
MRQRVPLTFDQPRLGGEGIGRPDASLWPRAEAQPVFLGRRGDWTAEDLAFYGCHLGIVCMVLAHGSTVSTGAGGRRGVLIGELTQVVAQVHGVRLWREGGEGVMLGQAYKAWLGLGDSPFQTRCLPHGAWSKKAREQSKIVVNAQHAKALAPSLAGMPEQAVGLVSPNCIAEAGESPYRVPALSPTCTAP